MKDQFIEKDGLLFLRCEPEPLEIDKHGKSLVRYIQDDTRMGLYNKEAVCEEKALEKVLLYEPRNIYIAGDHHTRFEVIAKHCPEGSREWALWKMLNGEMVHMSRFPYKALDGEIYCINSAGEIYPATSYQLWLENKAKDGWKIYEEPKFKAGDWVRCKYYNTYHQICEVHKGTIVHRQAGLPRHNDAYKEHCTDVFEVETEPASIEPDFSNVEIGDECFSLFYGKCKINAISNTDEPGYRICQEYRIGIAPCNGILDTIKHRVDGKLFKEASYPQLFNDHHQAKAYFDELFRKLDEE